MIILLGSLILIILLSIYFLNLARDQNSAIPYATYKSYPVVGQFFSFAYNQTKFLIECRQRYGHCFRIKVLNRHYTMILSQRDWINIVKHPLFKYVGPDFGVKIFNMTPIYLSTSELLRLNQILKLFLLGQPEYDVNNHRLQIEYLNNQDSLRSMANQLNHQIRKLIRNHQMECRKNATASEWMPSNLLKLIHHLLYQPSTLALIGEMNSTLTKHFHYSYLSIPRSIHTWLFSHQTNLSLQNSSLNISNDFILSSFFWGSLGSTILTVFWSLFYILRDEKLLQIIKEEMDIHLSVIHSNTDWTLEQLDACTCLESVILETLRLFGSSFLTRKCIRSTEITLEDGRRFNVESGETLAWCPGASLFDENVYPEPKKFIFDRFLHHDIDNILDFFAFENDKSNLLGKFFIKYKIKICLAILLQCIDYQLTDKETIPSQSQSPLGVGIVPPNNDIPIIYRYKL